LGTARCNHTATLLPNGKVLVAGGIGSNFTVLSSAELYDPATGIWTATGSLATARVYHTATLLASGEVLVAAGFNTFSTHLRSAELYDPASGTWTSTGSLSLRRDKHTATLLQNGQVLVAGGARGGNNLASRTELYDPASGTWSLTDPLLNPNNRKSHTATLLPNGQVLVAGGVRGFRGGGLSTAGLYDPVRGMWAATASLGSARFAHTATLLPSGQVLVAGGVDSGASLASAELYESAPEALDIP
jgi:N-acetylneuraminic acid mutarotase